MKSVEWKPQEISESNNEIKPEPITADNIGQYLESIKKITSGVGDYTLKIDNRYGLWAGSQIYSQANFKVSSSGTVQRIILEKLSALPTTGSIGELAFISSGSLYICTAITPALVWSKIGLQN